MNKGAFRGGVVFNREALAVDYSELSANGTRFSDVFTSFIYKRIEKKRLQ